MPESSKVEANPVPSSASIPSSNPLLDPDPVLPKTEPWLSPPTPAQTTVVASASSTSSISADTTNEHLRRQMDAFEKEQQQKFVREIEEHKRQLESQQTQHRNIQASSTVFYPL